MDVLAEFHMLNPLQPVIMITAYVPSKMRCAQMQNGATNFHPKAVGQ